MNPNEPNGNTPTPPATEPQQTASTQPPQSQEGTSPYVMGNIEPMPATASGQASPQSISSAPPKKSKFWLIFSTILAVLTLAPVVLFVALMAGLGNSANQGQSGTEFVALALYVTLVPAFGILLVIDTICAIVYLVRRKPRGKKLILPIATIATTLLFISYIAYNFYMLYSGTGMRNYYEEKMIPKDEALGLIESCQVSTVNKSYGGGHPDHLTLRDGNDKFVHPEDVADLDAAALKNSQKCGTIKSSKATSGGVQYSALTVNEATTLLTECKVIGFYYPGSSGMDETEAQQALAKTGIVLVSDMDGNPIRIHVLENQLSAMVPIARNAQKSCPRLQFWSPEKGYE